MPFRPGVRFGARHGCIWFETLEVIRMTFLQAVKSGFSKYFEPSGRSSRAEYWWFHLFFWGGLVGICFVVSLLGLLCIWLVDDQIFSQFADQQIATFSDMMLVPYLADLADLEIGLMFTFFAAAIAPYLAVSVRRLHDRNASGWGLLLWLTPVLVAMISNVDRFGELHPNVMAMMQRGSFIGPVSLLIVFCLKGAPDANCYGANPLLSKRT
jgi:uncharacterized membrane protein YhaH (DUF805 family)